MRLSVVCGLIAGGLAVTCALGVDGFNDIRLNLDWDQATGLTFAPDGRGFVWEKGGVVWLLENGQKSSQPLIDLTEEVGNWRDHGLLGFALDPNYLSNGYIYLFYVVDYHHLRYFGTAQYDPNADEFFRDTQSRITRYTCDPATNFRTVIPGSRRVLVGEAMGTGFPVCYQSHGVGTLLFGEDGSLLASHGESASYEEPDTGGPRNGSSNTALADGIISTKEDVGAYRAQLVDSLDGKIIRIDPATGDGLTDNPFYDSSAPRAARSRVWAMGLRNPFRMALRPGSGHNNGPDDRFPGVLCIGDVGWETREELNVCTQSGQNFGWPIYEGHDPTPLYPTAGPENRDAPNPLAGQGCSTFIPFTQLLIQDTLDAGSWPNPCNTGQQIPASIPRFMHRRAALDWNVHGFTRVPIYVGQSADIADIGTPASGVIGQAFGGKSSTGGVWYTGTNFPAQFQGTYFQADFVGGWIRDFVFDASHKLTEVRPFLTAGAVVCLAVNPVDGNLYYINYADRGFARVHRVQYGGNAPPTAVASATPRYGPSPLTVQFTGAASTDPENQPLQYEWDFGDGSEPSALVSPVHTYQAGGAGPRGWAATLTVTDSGGLIDSTSVRVSANNTPPTATIVSPVDGTLYRPGSPARMLVLDATVSDPQSPPDNLSCLWLVVLHHNDHSHPEPFIESCYGETLLNSYGCQGEDFFWEFRFIVTDPEGLATFRSARMFPSCCVADVDDGSGTGQPDGGVTIEDLLYFVTAFEVGDIAADVDDGSGTGRRDGGVTIDDLLYFVQRFSDGC